MNYMSTAILVADTAIYTLKMNLLTFANFLIPIKMHVIGLPASVAATPVIGDCSQFEYFIDELLMSGKRLILGLNLRDDILNDKVVNMRMLPTFIFRHSFKGFKD